MDIFDLKLIEVPPGPLIPSLNSIPVFIVSEMF